MARRAPDVSISSSARSESPGSTFDSAHGILDDGDVEALASRVEHGVLDAVVGREARDEEAVTPRSRRSSPSRRVLEAGISLAVRVLALVDHDVDLGPLQVRMELGAGRSRHAVHRPDRMAGRRRATSRGRPPRPRTSRGRRECQSRVAITRSKRSRSSLIGPAISIAVGDRQRTARREVVLEVDDQEGVHGRNGMDLPDARARRSPDGLLAGTGSYSRHAMAGAGREERAWVRAPRPDRPRTSRPCSATTGPAPTGPPTSSSTTPPRPRTSPRRRSSPRFAHSTPSTAAALSAPGFIASS